ncbi:MAG: DUF5060 domain-containing protein [Chloroflexi bacterium]|nr:DUF5060 domain-containing protein [Chloroflexota bacterium]
MPISSAVPRSLRQHRLAALIALLCGFLAASTWENRPVIGAELPTVSGPRTVWQPLTISFAGPAAAQAGGAPNPFLDYRLTVHLQGPSGKTYSVPGYFDGDGNGGPSGAVWRARFTPDASGAWSYRASFRAGPNVAVSLDAAAGTPAAFDGVTGSISIAPRDSAAPGFLRSGRLEYVGGHYLKLRDGPYWIKTGANSPENLLGYAGFSNTPAAHHTYAPHVRDWRAGDPILLSSSPDVGKGLIGALNYLSNQGVNAVYFMPMNVGGDARDTWPFAGSIVPTGAAANDNRHYDLAKLRQWETAFEYAQRRGVALHMVLGEAEEANKLELDSATLGVERKLFYREMVARFGHHNALIWNVTEEYDHQLPLAPERVKEFAQYIADLDPYDHPVTVHHWNNPDTAWMPFVGDRRFSIASLQYAGSVARHGDEVEEWRGRTASSGRPIPISLDEVRSSTPTNAEAQRREILWPTLLSGGSLEWYVGSQDQTLEDFRTIEPLWTASRHARAFVEALPFWEMSPDDSLVVGAATTDGGVQVFAKGGEVYAIYLPSASPSGRLRLPAGEFERRWYDPRTGAYSAAARLSGGGEVALGSPPSQASADWAMVVTRVGAGGPTLTPAPTRVSTPTATPGAGAPRVTGFVGAADGGVLRGNVVVEATVAGADVRRVEFTLAGGRPATWAETAAPYYFQGDTNGTPRGWDTRQYPDGQYVLTATAVDGAGRTGAAEIRIHVANLAATPTRTPAATRTPTPAAGPMVTGFSGVADGQTLGGRVAIAALVSGAGIQRVTFTLIGPQSITATETQTPYYFQGDTNGVPHGWDTRTVPNGEYTLTAEARDVTGRTHSRQVRLRIDNST